MLYSSGVGTTVIDAKKILELAGSGATMVARKIETSDPSELDQKYLAVELGRDGFAAAAAAAPAFQSEEKKPFARPKGPGRKR